jgi:hypothetical protein
VKYDTFDANEVITRANNITLSSSYFQMIKAGKLMRMEYPNFCAIGHPSTTDHLRGNSYVLDYNLFVYVLLYWY